MNALINKLASNGKTRRSIIFFLGITGLAVGMLTALLLPSSKFGTIAAGINDYASGGSLIYTGTLDLFLEALIRYGHTSILIWILAFSAFGLIASAILLTVKFVSAGFTAAVLTRCFGWRGIVYVFFSCAIQQCIMLAVYSVMFSVSIRFANVYHNGKKPVSAKHFRQYVVLLAACEIAAIVTAVLEAFVLRNIIIFINVLP